MNYMSLGAALALATLLTFATAAGNGPVPQGWIVTGASPSSYDVGTTPGAGSQRGTAAFIKSKGSSAGFGTLMQMIQAADYAGKRVRFSANVRTEDVNGMAGLWMRVDGRKGEDGRAKALAFDNMGARPIKGSTGWQRYEVVLDVDKEAHAIAYGILVSRDGAAWMDDVKLEVVSPSIPVTAAPMPEPVLPRQPNNLDFTR